MRFMSLITTALQVSYARKYILQDFQDFEVVRSWIKSGCNFGILISRESFQRAVMISKIDPLPFLA